jgi:hypothetical protein
MLWRLARVVAGSRVAEEAVAQLIGLAKTKAAPSLPPGPGPDGYSFSPERLRFVAGITLKDQRAGTLAITSDLELLQDRLRVQFMIVALLLVVAIGVALFMSSRLESLVSKPVTALARTAGPGPK